MTAGPLGFQAAAPFLLEKGKYGMKAFLSTVCAIVAALGLASAVSADSTSMSNASAAPKIVTPDSLNWAPVPGLAGAMQALVYGDLNKAESVNTVRIKLADGTKIPIHSHDADERVTVLSGTFMVGVGHSVDMASMKALSPGSFVYVPAGVYHYAMAKGETVVQVTAKGSMALHLAK
ncbi:MAG: hypothetical protein DLM53_11145 [Candidatus Eremiobacter antarcticus]|nr:cupin domain-containing protein [Candidatus Eremiobacteraeota bacterium]PZR60897.1 MAG: hypothetical protein DLM53_11145 [Candidatus Eremiobacter sp. RRmetagenome_bin22]